MQLKTLLLFLVIWLKAGETTAQETIKMVGANHQPVVAGELNGKRAYFLIDTGSDVTLLNLEDAVRYKFKYRRTTHKNYTLTGLNAKYQREFFSGYKIDLYLGGKELNGKFKVFDLSHIIQSIWLDTGIRINGIIGSDMMKKYHFVINYKAREISFASR